MRVHASDDKEYDVIVVGSGAAGGIAAKELGERGLSVLVLEAGDHVSAPSGSPPARKQRPGSVELPARIAATLTGQPLQSRVAFFSAAMKRFLVNDWVNPYSTSPNAPFLWIRGRQVGGRLHVFGRVLFRWSDYDFKGADRRGGSGDWPVSYADLEPYYEKIERLFGVHGNKDEVETAPDGIMAQPAPFTDGEHAFNQAVKSRWPERRTVAWRFAPPDQTALPTALAAAMATGRVTLRPNAIVKEITADPITGRATGAVYIDRNTRQPHHVAARAVVLCASPVESVRLLLNSRSARHPGGIGNRSGLLGRYFMDQTAALVFATCPVPKAKADSGEIAQPGASGGVYIPSYAHLQAADGRGIEASYSFQGSVGRKAAHPSNPGQAASFMIFGEMLPYEDNTVSLDPHRRDQWGIPVPVIRCTLHESEHRGLPRQIKDAVEMIEAAGGAIEGWVSPLGLEERGKGLFAYMNPLSRWLIRKMMPRCMVMGAAIHESGGARMGSNPTKSVLNPNNQCWDVPNVFVTDASAFPSSGAMGTTLTVMALTARACEYLAQQLKTGNL